MIYRKARMTDVEAIHGLINNYAEVGLMLARSRSSLYECLREYTVAEKDGAIIGVGGLHILWYDLAEIRALAIAPEYSKQGIGRQIVSLLEKEARDLGLPRLFALTYRQEFFVKCGFKEVDKKELPQKVWKECIDCPKFPHCEEQAVIKIL
ncbi:N-acetyltransferase [Candidatus Formimonas warabiya]|uniref:GNAT family N-acetyltransferase n=1 Tax=Formimonas warabiya TaxID=1761012 RepID=A0A3G1KY26_FORW1|nr:N-acetyltransferase [Candidatus Formimonas warabiya]ATW27297.1 GNAT family N-acetyltransferase [Candidatus Formimonas warabiya]